MKYGFQVKGLPINYFVHMFKLPSLDLSQLGAQRLIADARPGFPCRVSLADAKIGENIIALPFLHHDTTSPYRASGPIFVREKAKEAKLAPGEIPIMLRNRLLSIRAYNTQAMMIAAEVVEGNEIEYQLAHLFADPQTAYLHIHNARPGCYNCLVTRT